MTSSTLESSRSKLLIIDTSALLQVIATEQLGVLRFLRSSYEIQMAIVEAVRSEAEHCLTNVPKFRGRQNQLRKAIGNNTLAVVNRDLLITLVGTSAEPLICQIESEGARLFRAVDRGEAYSHAASMVLDVPIVTNDASAVRKLLRDGECLPRPILRFWDLIVFAHQCGHVDARACDKIRQALRKLREKTHPCFTNRSFEEGLQQFYPRMISADYEIVGAEQPQDELDHDPRFVVRRA